MKYICVAYVGEGWSAMTGRQGNAALDEVFGYTDERRASGHLLAAEGLSERPERRYVACGERQSVRDRWPRCRDERENRETLGAGSPRFEARHPLDVKTSRGAGRWRRDSGGAQHGLVRCMNE